MNFIEIFLSVPLGSLLIRIPFIIVLWLYLRIVLIMVFVRFARFVFVIVGAVGYMSERELTESHESGQSVNKHNR